MLISAAMIVKNEEKNLGRCLNSIKDFVDEIVIIDTGSEDRTPEIAREYGAKVIFSPWRYDFSFHRNESIEECSGDWILVIDADEELIGKRERFREWLKGAPWEADAIVIDLKDMQDDDVYMSFNSSRFFRRGQITYKNIVHNKPEFDGKAIFSSFVHLKHYGYDLTEAGRDRKYHRTMSLLQARLKQNPNDWPVYFYMAQLFPQKQRLKSALACCLTYIRHKDEVKDFNDSIWFTLLQLALKLKDLKTVDDYFRQALEALPYDVDVSFAVMEYGIMKKDPEIISEGASRFIVSYDQIRKNPLSKKQRFVYQANDKTLTFALYHLALIRLNDGLRLLERLKDVMPYLDDEYRENVENDLARELPKIGIKWIHKEAA